MFLFVVITVENIAVLSSGSVKTRQPGTDAFSLFQCCKAASVHADQASKQLPVLSNLDEHCPEKLSSFEGFLQTLLHSPMIFADCCLPLTCIFCFLKSCICVFFTPTLSEALSFCRRCGGAVSCTMVTVAPVSIGRVHL